MTIKAMNRTMVALALLAAAGLAQAHAHLHESQPANNATLSTAPTAVSLKFSEAVQVTALTLKRDGDPLTRKLEPLPKAASADVSVPLPALKSGDYTVTYRVLSDDGHLMSGTVKFKLQ